MRVILTNQYSDVGLATEPRTQIDLEAASATRSQIQNGFSSVWDSNFDSGAVRIGAGQAYGGEPYLLTILGEDVTYRRPRQTWTDLQSSERAISG